MMDDTLPLAFATSYVDIPDWTVFARRLIRNLLCQIYKGSMLRSLSEWFTTALNIDFPSILTEEVRRMSTTLENMPSRYWRLHQYYHASDWSIYSARDKDKGNVFGVASDWSIERLLERILTYPEQAPEDADPKTIFEYMDLYKTDYGSLEMLSFLEKKFRGYRSR